MDNAVVSFDRKNSMLVGDLVVLKSGSPVMTVRSYIPGKGGYQGTVTVDWFVSEENYSASFFEDQLLEAVISAAPKVKRTKSTT